MNSLVADLLYGTATTLLGAIGASWLCWFHFHRKTPARSSPEARGVAEALGRLYELTTRVAVDVDEHSSQVEEINDELAAAGSDDAAMIVDAVARLIHTNQHLQDKLAATEDKLREQTEQIQLHAAEARTDSLTLLANRRAFDDELARHVAEFRRHGRAFSLIMADVDRFKKFNDVHGHQNGRRGVAGRGPTAPPQDARNGHRGALWRRGVCDHPSGNEPGRRLDGSHARVRGDREVPIPPP